MTADEYRKTISKDAALERRFQPVTIDEPTVESTISILRGLKPRYEVCPALVLDAHTVYPCVTSIQVHHGVEISDGALVTGLLSLTSASVVPKLTTSSAAVYAARYISDRFLPDKAIDLVDEAASSLRLAQESKPDALEQLDRAVMTMQIELTSLRNESDPLSTERRGTLEQALERTRKEAAALEERWQAGT